MTIALPALPRGTDVSQKLLRFGGDLKPGLGGPILRILRLGSRWQFDVSLPPMDLDCARAWLAVRAKSDAEGDTLRLTLKPMGPDSAAVVGRMATSGAGAGLVISSGAGVAVGMTFSFVKDGHSYLHMVTGVAGANLTVSPLLRANPAGLALEFAAPAVDGFVDDLSWTMQRLRFVGQSFTLVEDR